LEELGFVDVVEKRTQFPVGTWAVGKKMKTLGAWMKMDMLAGLQAMSMAIMTRGLGMTPEEVAVHLENVKTEIESNKLHAYFPVYVIPYSSGFQLLICGQSASVWPQALGLEAAAVPYPILSDSKDSKIFSPSFSFWYEAHLQYTLTALLYLRLLTRPYIPKADDSNKSNIKVEKMTNKKSVSLGSPCPFSPNCNQNLQRDTALTYSHNLNLSLFPVNVNSQPLFIYSSSHFLPSPIQTQILDLN
jgi:hypothetical protein